MLQIPRLLALGSLLFLVAAATLLTAPGTVPPAHAAASQTAAVQAHLLWSRYDGAAVARQLDEAKRAGAGMVRVDLGWASLEPSAKGQYSSWYLAKIDRVVDGAQARGLEVLFTVWETPCWASSAPDELKQDCAGSWWGRGVQRYPPARASDYADALAYLAGRYGRRVAAWEVWNEPNHDDYLRAADQVASYASLVKAAYPAAKAADPGATIVAGSLADADYEFTSALYGQGVKGSFDAWSVHPYSEDRSPLHPGFPGWEQASFVSGVPRVRAAMLEQGDDKPLWLTEFGWSTCDVRGDAAWRNCVDADTQAQYLQQTLAQMRAFASYVPVGVWFNLQDTSSDPGNRVGNYGLLSFSGAEKPAFAAFRAGAQALAAGDTPAPGEADPSPVEATDPTPIQAPAAAPTPPAAPPTPETAAAAPAGAAPGERTLTGDTSGGSDSLGGARALAEGKDGEFVLRAVRRRGLVRIAGALPVGRTLHVRAYPWKRGAKRFSRRTRYRRLIRVSPSGRFRHRLTLAALRHGKWKIVVKGRRLPRLQATTIVR